jgi:hypothetical protein
MRLLIIVHGPVFSQVFDQPDQSETGGLYFPMAVSNLCMLRGLVDFRFADCVESVVGLYIEQISLACLFFLKISVSRTSSIIEGVLMIVLFFITLGMHIFVKSSFDRTFHRSDVSNGIWCWHSYHTLPSDVTRVKADSKAAGNGEEEKGRAENWGGGWFVQPSTYVTTLILADSEELK